MTLIVAIVFGIATGLSVRESRRRLWITAIAVAVMLPIQSFVMPLFHKPGFSLSDPGYWATQPAILGVGLLIAAGLGRLRDRRRQAHLA